MTTDDRPRAGFFKELDVDFLIHELKDPIAVIETGARMLLERQDQRGQLTPIQERTVQRMLRNTVKARDMLYGLLEVGRAEAGAHEAVSFIPAHVVTGLLMDILSARCDWNPGGGGSTTVTETDPQMLMAAHGVELHFSASVEALPVYQDRVKFEHILGNLIRNGLDYRKRRLEVTLDADSDGLMVAVRDDGPGIPMRLQETVFRRYTRLTTREPLARQGHGLGLAGSRILARAMGGDIFLKSNPGDGSEFRVQLPFTCPQG